ncbi:DoxX protein [Mycobacteroides abscessus]|nr:DoxX protein [Mycobacteroides abscessus]
MTGHSDDPQVWRKPPELVDPEDDVPSATYGGDFETTAIPHYQAERLTSSHNVKEVGPLYDPAPLPYAEPATTQISAEAVHARHAAPWGTQDPAGDRRGTQDLGLLLLRVGVGAVLIAHGLRKVFGWWGGTGLSGFEATLGDRGFKYADILTYVGVTAELGAGVLLVLGLLTPLAGAAALAFTVNVLLSDMVSDKANRYAIFWPEGHEFELLMIVAIVAGSSSVLVGTGLMPVAAGLAGRSSVPSPR